MSPVAMVPPPSRSPARELRAQLQEHRAYLFARAMRLTRNPTQASDLVQDSLVRALEFEHSYCPGTNLRAWLQQVLFSVFATSCRRRKRERAALQRLTDDPCAWTQSEPEPMGMRGLTTSVEAVMDSLPEQYQLVLRLVDLHEHSYRQAAERLGVPIGTVMSRLSRGRKMLAQALDLPLERAA